MKFNTWPYWVKGGIIGLLVPIITFIRLWVCFNNASTDGEDIGCAGRMVNVFFLYNDNIVPIPYQIFEKFWPWSQYILFGISVLFWPLAGILVGFIYGKFKKRNDISLPVSTDTGK